MSTNNNFCTVRTQDLAYIHWREDAAASVNQEITLLTTLFVGKNK